MKAFIISLIDSFLWRVRGGLIARKILKKFDKTGWDISKYGMGIYLAICLCLFA